MWVYGQISNLSQSPTPLFENLGCYTQPQVEDRPLPKKNQDNAPQVKKSMKKRKGSTCCYVYREKGHFASSCLNG